MLSTLAPVTVEPTAIVVEPDATHTAVPAPTPPPGFTPAQISAAYGLNSLTIKSGQSNGTGQTVAVVVPYNDTKIASDLATFSTQFGLPTASLTIVNQAGATTALPAANTAWALETSLDVEWVHAIAPGAKILLVEATSSGVTDLMAAVQTASKGVTVSGVTLTPSVVSMSWGTNEFAGETQYDASFSKAGVTFVTASGDAGGSAGAQWPATSPDVLSVGGTTLTIKSTGSGASIAYSYGSETAWSLAGTKTSGYSGSGGGLSAYEATPAYQSTLGLAKRATPDVAYNGALTTGVAVYDSLGSGWSSVGGTSAGAPQWAALVAIADQGRAAAGTTLLSSSTAVTAQNNVLSLLYSAGTNTKTASTLFHDITSGSNSAGSAKAGYDLVTGLGSPIANTLVSYLVTPTATSGGTTTSTGTSSGGTKGVGGTVKANALLASSELFAFLGPIQLSTTTTATGPNSSITTSVFAIVVDAKNTHEPIVVLTVVTTLSPGSLSPETPLATVEALSPGTPATVARGQSVDDAFDGEFRFYSYDQTGVSKQSRNWRDIFGPAFDAIDHFVDPEANPGAGVHADAPVDGRGVPLARSGATNRRVGRPAADDASDWGAFGDAIETVRISPTWAAGAAAIIGGSWGLRSRPTGPRGARSRVRRFSVDKLEV